MGYEYVRFQRGSQAAYEALKKANRLDENTLYFIYDDDNNSVGALYMGARIISSGDVTIASASLDDLTDVIISATGENSFLVQDASKHWVSKSLDDVISLITSGIVVNELEADNASIVITDNKISIAGFEAATAGLIPVKGENNNLNWVQIDTYTKSEIENLISNNESAILAAVDGKLSAKADKATTLAGYGIEDAYTKNEVYTRSQTDAAITEAVKQVSGAESAAAVLADLTAYKKAVNDEIWGDPDLTNENLTATPSRLDAIEDQLASLSAGEMNYISSVDNANFVVVDGKLNFNPDAGRLITSNEIAALQAVTDGNFDNFIKSVDTEVFSVNETGNLNLIAIPNDLLTPVIGDMTTLVNYTENTTVVNELNTIYDILTWKSM